MLVILAAVFYFYGDNLFKNNNEIYEENKTAMFNVSKIQYYSDVNAVSNQTTYQNPEWNLNVYQYGHLKTPTRLQKSNLYYLSYLLHM